MINRISRISRISRTDRIKTVRFTFICFCDIIVWILRVKYRFIRKVSVLFRR